VHAVQVIKDLKLMGTLLHEMLTPFQQLHAAEHRIVVFIDDLDRCKPDSIIQVYRPSLQHGTVPCSACFSESAGEAGQLATMVTLGCPQKAAAQQPSSMPEQLHVGSQSYAFPC